MHGINQLIMGGRRQWIILFKLFLVEIQVFCIPESYKIISPLFCPKHKCAPRHCCSPRITFSFHSFLLSRLLSKVFIFAFPRNGSSKKSKECEEGRASFALEMLSLFTLQWRHVSITPSPLNPTTSTGILEEAQMGGRRMLPSTGGQDDELWLTLSP